MLPHVLGVFGVRVGACCLAFRLPVSSCHHAPLCESGLVFGYFSLTSIAPMEKYPTATWMCPGTGKIHLDPIPKTKSLCDPCDPKGFNKNMFFNKNHAKAVEARRLIGRGSFLLFSCEERTHSKTLTLRLEGCPVGLLGRQWRQFRKKGLLVPTWMVFASSVQVFYAPVLVFCVPCDVFRFYVSVCSLPATVVSLPEYRCWVPGMVLRVPAGVLCSGFCFMFPEGSVGSSKEMLSRHAQREPWTEQGVTKYGKEMREKCILCNGTMTNTNPPLGTEETMHNRLCSSAFFVCWQRRCALPLQLFLG
ncbi:unnamed protein product [Durusdinium trenchii]|uniref:Uncharacterized protein n=1 Tax=Durusdinium trenchii TaxID=1381693 RepID=A0ABP0KXL7_9DINO